MESKSILFATSEESVKDKVFEALGDIETYSLTFVGDSGDLLLSILETDIDLAIVDLKLTGVGSSKLIEIIKRSRPRIPLIIISSGKSLETEARILEQGVFYIIIEPVNGEELRNAVESALK
jgi:DNA-binding NtrC family response regulator